MNRETQALLCELCVTIWRSKHSNTFTELTTIQLLVFYEYVLEVCIKDTKLKTLQSIYDFVNSWDILELFARLKKEIKDWQKLLTTWKDIPKKNKKLDKLLQP